MSFRVIKRFFVRQAKNLPRKGRRYNGSFHGDDDGTWELGGYLKGGWDWDAALSLSTTNEYRNISVDGATEHHAGFRKALHEIVREYPELREFVIAFDGPSKKVTEFLGEAPEHEVRWEHLTFYHGTSGNAAAKILVEGLHPRASTNVEPAYGRSSTAGPGRPEAIYLTTQLQMAKFGARDAASAHGGMPTILEVRGIDGANAQADEDSKETDPAMSLARIGSIAYMGSIPASKIKMIFQWKDNTWTPV